MKYRGLVLSFYGGLLMTSAGGVCAPIDELFVAYKQEAGGEFDAASGQALWNRQVKSSKSEQRRSCATCHMADPRVAGKHATTGKAIKPMAPSINPARLNDIAKVEKWLRRNCKWTLDRLCTAQEKGDVLRFLKGQ